MKTLAWLFGIFVCASSAYGQKTVTIEGDIRNMPDTVRFFCAEMKGNGMDVRPEDQEKMVNGKFKFTREADRTTKKSREGEAKLPATRRLGCRLSDSKVN